MDAIDPRAKELLAFWLGSGARDKRWFQKDAAFDAEIRERFATLYGSAAAGELDGWKQAPASCLALIVLLDQFPRNMFRGTARAFESDAQALAAARHSLSARYDAAMSAVERLFAYLPFEHSENLADQVLACELTRPLAAFAETWDAHRYAVQHFEIVRRFGRFPHRNALLGRASTAEELAFLKGPGSRF